MVVTKDPKKRPLSKQRHWRSTTRRGFSSSYITTLAQKIHVDHGDEE